MIENLEFERILFTDKEVLIQTKVNTLVDKHDEFSAQEILEWS